MEPQLLLHTPLQQLVKANSGASTASFERLAAALASKKNQTGLLVSSNEVFNDVLSFVASVADKKARQSISDKLLCSFERFLGSSLEQILRARLSGPTDGSAGDRQLILGVLYVACHYLINGEHAFGTAAAESETTSSSEKQMDHLRSYISFKLSALESLGVVFDRRDSLLSSIDHHVSLSSEATPTSRHFALLLRSVLIACFTQKWNFKAPSTSLKLLRTKEVRASLLRLTSKFYTLKPNESLPFEAAHETTRALMELLPAHPHLADFAVELVDHIATVREGGTALGLKSALYAVHFAINQMTASSANHPRNEEAEMDNDQTHQSSSDSSNTAYVKFVLDLGQHRLDLILPFLEKLQAALWKAKAVVRRHIVDIFGLVLTTPPPKDPSNDKDGRVSVVESVMRLVATRLVDKDALVRAKAVGHLHSYIMASNIGHEQFVELFEATAKRTADINKRVRVSAITATVDMIVCKAPLILPNGLVADNPMGASNTTDRFLVCIRDTLLPTMYRLLEVPHDTSLHCVDTTKAVASFLTQVSAALVRQYGLEIDALRIIAAIDSGGRTIEQIATDLIQHLPGFTDNPKLAWKHLIARYTPPLSTITKIIDRLVVSEPKQRAVFAAIFEEAIDNLCSDIASIDSESLASAMAVVNAIGCADFARSSLMPSRLNELVRILQNDRLYALMSVNTLRLTLQSIYAAIRNSKTELELCEDMLQELCRKTLRYGVAGDVLDIVFTLSQPHHIGMELLLAKEALAFEGVGSVEHLASLIELVGVFADKSVDNFRALGAHKARQMVSDCSLMEGIEGGKESKPLSDSERMQSFEYAVKEKLEEMAAEFAEELVHKSPLSRFIPLLVRVIDSEHLEGFEGGKLFCGIQAIAVEALGRLMALSPRLTNEKADLLVSMVLKTPSEDANVRLVALEALGRILMLIGDDIDSAQASAVYSSLYTALEAQQPRDLRVAALRIIARIYLNRVVKADASGSKLHLTALCLIDKDATVCSTAELFFGQYFRADRKSEVSTAFRLLFSLACQESDTIIGARWGEVVPKLLALLSDEKREGDLALLASRTLPGSSEPQAVAKVLRYVRPCERSIDRLWEVCDNTLLPLCTTQPQVRESLLAHIGRATKKSLSDKGKKSLELLHRALLSGKTVQLEPLSSVPQLRSEAFQRELEQFKKKGKTLTKPIPDVMHGLPQQRRAPASQAEVPMEGATKATTSRRRVKVRSKGV